MTCGASRTKLVLRVFDAMPDNIHLAPEDESVTKRGKESEVCGS